MELRHTAVPAAGHALAGALRAREADLLLLQGGEQRLDAQGQHGLVLAQKLQVQRLLALCDSPDLREFAGPAEYLLYYLHAQTLSQHTALPLQQAVSPQLALHASGRTAANRFNESQYEAAQPMKQDA